MQDRLSRYSRWRAQIEQEVARAHGLMAKSLELLKEPTPDTFLGRWQHGPKPVAANKPPVANTPAATNKSAAANTRAPKPIA
jgi:hypothetical protein